MGPVEQTVIAGEDTNMDTNFQTLDVCLRTRALRSPEVSVFTYVDDGGRKATSVSYKELDRRARAIAAAIRSRTTSRSGSGAAKGQRVLLLFAPGLDFIAALYGVYYAGAVAVPAYPPEPSRIQRTLPRLQAIVRDADPALVLTTAPLLSMARAVFPLVPDIAALEWIATDEITARSGAPEYTESGLRPGDLALVQYTSGSTSVPKGVMVSHRNILENLWMIQRASGQDQEHVISSWLPHGHDLGLMGGIFLPVVIGGRAVLMSPLDFLRRPMTWLSSIEQYRATDTFVPNFALDLCVRKTTSAERKTLDLGSLKLCVVAAEPVRAATVERFLRAFEKQGFPRRGMIPGYGLAEAVVAVTGGPYGAFHSVLVDAEALAQNRFVEVDRGHPKALPLVACGKPFEKVEVEIVRPETGASAGAGEVGEIWIRAPSVAMGYWRKEEQTAETFGARLLGSARGADTGAAGSVEGSEGRYLRTGDLGYVREGYLFITGRIKDLIVIRGRNYYPQDIELTVERCHPRVRPGGVIAFAVDHGGVERVVVVAEVDAGQLPTEEQRSKAFAAVISAVRVTVNTEHGLQVHGVALVRNRTIDKTSSGKLARRSCRARYLEGTLEIEASWTLSDLTIEEAPVSAVPASQDDPFSARRPLVAALQQAPAVERFQMLTEYLGREIARLATGGGVTLSEDTRLQEIGLDSLSAMDLAGRIEKDLGVKLPVVKLLESTSLGDLVEHLLDSMETDVDPVSQSLIATLAPPPPSSQPLTPLSLAHRTLPPPVHRPSHVTVVPAPHLPDAVRMTPPPPALRPASMPPPSHKTLPNLGEVLPPSSRPAPASVRLVRQTAPPGSGRPAFTQAVALRGFVSQTPVFCVGGLGGTVHYLMALAGELGAPHPFIAFQAPGVDGAEAPMRSVEEMARRYLDELRAIQPVGPYVLAGHSFGGLVAYEMAQRLTERGETVSHVFLVDTSAAQGAGAHGEAEDIMAMFELVNMFRRFLGKPQSLLQHGEIAGLAPDQQRAVLAQQLGSEGGLLPGSAAANVLEVYMASFAAIERYRPVPYSGAVTLFRAEEGLPPESKHPARALKVFFDDASLGWKGLCPALRIIEVPGDHFSMVLPPHVASLAEAMRSSLADARMELGMERILPARGAPRAPGRPIEVSRRGVSFNPYHSAFVEDPYPVLHQLRAHDPVHWSTMSCWWITRYSDVTAGLRDRRFSADNRNAASRPDRGFDVQADSAKPSVLTSWFRKQEDQPLARLFNNVVMFLDAPRHPRLRRLLAPSFEASVMRGWKEYIDEQVEELIAEMSHRRDADVIRDLALTLPISVVSEILGVPRADAHFLRDWSYGLTQAADPFVSNEAAMRASTIAADFLRYMQDHVEARRKAPPKSDLLGLLLEAEAEGERLTTDELVATCVFLFLAGFETTTNVIGNSVLALLRNPDQLALLRARPELAENAAEELMRYDGALRMAFRTALEDVEMGGKTIRRGESVLFVLLAANRDPAAFPDPDRLDITRSAKNHIAFSHGPHYCLGAPLARMELASVISALARRDLALVPGGFEWRSSLSFRGLDRLRIKILQ